MSTPHHTAAPPDIPPGHVCALQVLEGDTIWAIHEKVAERSWWLRSASGQATTALPSPQPGRAVRAWRLPDRGLLTSTGRSSATLGSLCAWSPTSHSLRWLLRRELLWLNQDHERALLRHDNGELEWWSLQSSAPRFLRRAQGCDLGIAQRHSTLAPGPQVSPDGTLALFLRPEGQLHQVNLHSGAELVLSAEEGDEIIHARFLGASLIFTTTDLGRCLLFDLQGQPLASLCPPPGHSLCPEVARLLPPDSLLLPCEESVCLRWDFRHDKVLWTSRLPPEPGDGSAQGPAHLIALAPAQDLAWLSHTNHCVQALDLQRGQWLASTTLKEPLTRLCLCPDGELVVGDQAGRLTWVDLQAAAKISMDIR